MVLVSEVREGSVLKLDGKLVKVLEKIHHQGQGKMSGYIELKLKDLNTGHMFDRHIKPEDRCEELDLSRRNMQFLYSDDDGSWFMDVENYEQIHVPKYVLGDAAKFFKENLEMVVEFLDEKPISVQIPRFVELKVVSTAPGVGGHENVMKPATLENGVEILVPQFIENGDSVRVDPVKGLYLERTPKKI